MPMGQQLLIISSSHIITQTTILLPNKRGKERNAYCSDIQSAQTGDSSALRVKHPNGTVPCRDKVDTSVWFIFFLHSVPKIVEVKGHSSFEARQTDKRHLFFRQNLFDRKLPLSKRHYFPSGRIYQVNNQPVTCLSHKISLSLPISYI